MKSHAVYYDNEVEGLRELNDLVDTSDQTHRWELLDATSINGDYIVGAGIINDDGVYRPYRLHRSSGVVDDLSGGWYTSNAMKVNAAGDTVGTGALTAEDYAASIGTAFVYTDVLGFKKLNDLIPQDDNWYLTMASSINAVGDMVGWANYRGGWGASPWHVRLPAGQSAMCTARSTCGGGDGDSICLYSDGVAEVSPGHFIAVFGFANAAANSVHPSVNEVRLDGSLVASPNPAPPTDLQAGTHTAAFLPTFDAGHTISWTVGGETVSASASSPRLAKIEIGSNGYGVMIGGELLALQPDTGPYANPPGPPPLLTIHPSAPNFWARWPASWRSRRSVPRPIPCRSSCLPESRACSPTWRSLTTARVRTAWRDRDGA